MCTSPKLFAACHVLLRLREPRHPPVALSYFFIFSYFFTKILSVIVSNLQLWFLLFVNSLSKTNAWSLFLLSFSNMSKSVNPIKDFCGEYRIRTDDPLLAKQVL